MLGAWSPLVLSILRIVAGLLFMAHGTGKFFDFPSSGMPSPEIFSLFGLAGLIETIGGALIVLGLFTRPAAFIASGECAVIYFMAHLPRDFFPTKNGGESAILFCFVFFLLIFSGPGPLSVDRIVRGRD